MVYDGRTAPGRSALVRELDGLTVRKLAVGPMNNNAYLLTETGSQASVLIDAAADWPAVSRMIADCGAQVEAIVTTHRHPDHTGALADAANGLGARTYAGAPDADHLPVPVDVRLQDGDTVRFGALSLSVALIRGHTPGSVVLSYADPHGHDHVFTGDTLFPGGVGATTNSSDQSFPDLIDDASERIFGRHDDSAWVYPGHGDDTTIGTERPHLAQWRERGW